MIGEMVHGTPSDITERIMSINMSHESFESYSGDPFWLEFLGSVLLFFFVVAFRFRI